jgi:hypothetical protein
VIERRGTRRSQPYLIILNRNFEFEFSVECSGINLKIIRRASSRRNARVVASFTPNSSYIRLTSLSFVGRLHYRMALFIAALSVQSPVTLVHGNGLIYDIQSRQTSDSCMTKSCAVFHIPINISAICRTLEIQHCVVTWRTDSTYAARSKLICFSFTSSWTCA